MTSQRKIAILGTGTMGRALGQGLLRAQLVAPADLRGTVRSLERPRPELASLGFAVGTDNPATARWADTVLLCTKPKRLRELVQELADLGALSHHPLLISIAAGVRTHDVESAAGPEARVVRVMPNTPCRLGEGMLVIAPGRNATEDDLAWTEALCAPLGRVMRLEEEHMNTVTPRTGSPSGTSSGCP